MVNYMAKHTHKYYRIRIGKNKRIEFKCGINGCVHHLTPELALGRLCICWVCGKEFYLNRESLKRAKPRCDECIERKIKVDESDVEAVLEVIGEK